MFVNRPNDEIAAILTVEVPCPLEGIFWHDLPLPRLKDRRTFLALVGIEAFCREADIYGAENFPPVYFMERL